MKLNHNKNLKTHDLPVYTMEDLHYCVWAHPEGCHCAEGLSKKYE